MRDLSFENPHAPDSLRGMSQPQIDLSVEMNARGRPDGLFEVDLKLGATATGPLVEGQPASVAFQVELLYGGLFEVNGVPEEHLETVLLGECPRFLFPFARRIIADCSMEGGFSPFMLEPIDFHAVYTAQRAPARRRHHRPGGGERLKRCLAARPPRATPQGPSPPNPSPDPPWRARRHAPWSEVLLLAGLSLFGSVAMDMYLPPCRRWPRSCTPPADGAADRLDLPVRPGGRGS